jgi:hypothetical protein
MLNEMRFDTSCQQQVAARLEERVNGHGLRNPYVRFRLRRTDYDDVIEPNPPRRRVAKSAQHVGKQDVA